MTEKYALHPGWIRSINDDDLHYIGIAQLARLYELQPHEYIVWDPHSCYIPLGYPHSDYDKYVHLYPSYQGNYGRPDEL